MKLATSFRGLEPLSLGVGVIVGCFLVSLTYVTMNKSDMPNFSMMESPISATDVVPSSFSSVENFSRTRQLELKSNSGCNDGSASSDLCEKNEFIETLRMSSFEDSDVLSTREDVSISTTKSESKEGGISSSCDPKSGRCEVNDGNKGGSNNAPVVVVDRSPVPVTSNPKKPDVEAESKPKPKPKPLCDTSNHRCDLCDIHGDIRITGKNASTVLLLTSSQDRRNESWQVKPYARKWDHGLHNIKVVNVRSTSDYLAAPQCTVAYTVPAVVFSMAGYVGNHFHDFSDVLVPLFQTARQFDGEVQLVVSHCNSWWIGKFAPFFRRMSRYEIIDYDRDERVHCFRRAIVGLRADGDLMIDPAKSPMGYTMSDFREFMRRTYALDRDYALRLRPGEGEKRPRMLIVSRSRSRKFMNLEQIVGLAKEMGFEVVVSEGAMNLINFSRIVNSCDVMLGVHGAGLTNLVFLPTNAVVIQVVPFGRHEWIASTYFGNPAKGMGLRYLEYTIGVEESTLTELYPRDDPVLTDPKSIHKLGWVKMGEIYLEKQNVRLDLAKFRPVLEEALQFLRE